jgi:hypothetical protein
VLAESSLSCFISISSKTTQNYKAQLLRERSFSAFIRHEQINGLLLL